MSNKMTLEDATRKWVNEFDSIPYALIEKAYGGDRCFEDIQELTPIGRRDYVCVIDGEYDRQYGYVESVDVSEETAEVSLDGVEEPVTIKLEDLEVERDGWLPMWGTLWTFGDKCDEWWLEQDNGIQTMADHGFRIYESDELGYFFGIDGAGYDFYEGHWIPLYKARGLQWHDKEA